MYALPSVYPITMMTAPAVTAMIDDSTGFLLKRLCEITETTMACSPCVTRDTNIGAG